MAKARFGVRCAKGAIWTYPARSGEQSAGFKLEKRLQYIIHGPKGARRPNVGLEPRFANKGKISQAQDLLNHPGDWERVEALKSELRPNKWYLRKALGLNQEVRRSWLVF